MTDKGEGPEGKVTDKGEMFANTEAFHSCMAKQASEKVCMKSASSREDKERVKTLTADYKENNFNMKRLFIKASLTCLGD